MPAAALLTVIVPGRDIAAYAPAAIASLRAQIEHRWHAILINDGSVDTTGAIFDAAAAADPRFTVIHHDTPRGLGAARNAGLARVDSEYLAFLDADDVFTPTALARLYSTLSQSGSDFTAGAYVRLRAVGDEYVPGRVQPWVSAATDPGRIRTTLDDHPEASANIVAWSKLYRTEFWGTRRFPEGVAYEDQVLAQQLYTEARAFDVIPNVVVHWRLRSEGTSITQSKSDLPVLRDYVAALLGGLNVLRAADASAAIHARLELILAMDIPPLSRIAATHPDPAYRETLEAFLDTLRTFPEFATARPNPGLADALNW